MVLCQEQPGAAAAPLQEEPLLMDADVMQAPHGLAWEAQQQPDNWVRGGGDCLKALVVSDVCLKVLFVADAYLDE